MNIYFLIPLASFFLSLFVVIAVLMSDPRNKINRLFSLYVTTIAWWGITEYLMRSSADMVTALFWSKMFSLGSIFMAPLFLTFVLFFTRSRITEKEWVYLVIFAPITFIAFLGYSTNVFTLPVMTPEYWGWHYQGTSLFPITMLIPFSYILLGLYLILRFYRTKAEKIEKKQSALFLVGVTFSLVVSGITQSPLPIGIKLVPLGTLSTAIKSCIYAYAMLRYRLLIVPPTVAMKTIFNTIEDLIIIIKPDKKISMVNPAALRLLKYDRNELIGKSAEDIFTGADLFREDKWIKFLEMGSVKSLKMNVTAKDGEKIPISFSASVARELNSISGVVSISLDMRETDKLVHELEKSRSELRAKLDELETFTRMAVGRELKMIELKKKIRDFEQANEKNAR